MINANELRIGSWVILDWDGDKRPQKIAEINRTNFEVQDWDEQFDAFNLYPIPLTPEILEKCGFEIYKDYPCYIKKYNNQGELILFSTGTPVGIANNLEPNFYYYGFNKVQHIIKYLHQLQNLYFALTQTELEIKL